MALKKVQRTSVSDQAYDILVKKITNGEWKAGEKIPSEIELAKQLGIYSKCVFAGNVYDICRAYHAMDLYCITSLHESFGQSLAEAWSAGLAAVTTDAKGFTEISENNVTSVICKTGDANAVANAVLDLYNNREKAERLAENGRALYKAKYDSKAFSRGIEQVYESICRK